jgi:hypothetical protein
MVLLLPVGKKIFPNDAYASGIASNPGSGDVIKVNTERKKQ